MWCLSFQKTRVFVLSEDKTRLRGSMDDPDPEQEKKEKGLMGRRLNHHRDLQ